MFKKYDITPGAGDVYFCTDLHGRYKIFMEALRVIRYRPPHNGHVRDMIFSCGDMMDRGEGNYELLQTFRLGPDKVPLLGNHEVMGYQGMTRGSQYYNHWIHNGGDWSMEYDDSVLIDVLEWANNLPYVIQVNLPNGIRIGLTHAGVPVGMHWDDLQAKLCGEIGISVQGMIDLQETLLWDRGIIKSESQHKIEGIDYVIHGHNTLREGVFQAGNRIYFDTGAAYMYPESNYHMTLLKYRPDQGGDIADGWLQVIKIRINESRMLYWE